MPNGQEIPKSPNYHMVFEEGDNKVRILADSIAGYKWQSAKDDSWNFAKEKPTIPLGEIKKDKFDNYIRFFVTMPVWSYRDEEVKLMELTQISIMDYIQAYDKNPEWGDVKEYDINIVKTIKGDKTTYSVQPTPKKTVNPKWLELLEEKKKENDRFKCKWKEEAETPKEEKNENEERIDDLPFS